MGGTHKKKLRAEKAKVKLKGAKLPKGLNVTKTEFKVRKIMLREQLRESNFVDGQRQVDLKDTLTRLKHPSSNFRMDGMRQLREAIVGGQRLAILGKLSEVIQGVSSLCLDVDKSTRRESFKTLSNLLGMLGEDAIAPFFNVISSYLRCAMTHIQPALQDDSLLMLDVLLQHVPQMVAMESARIFRSFVEMISHVRSDGELSGRTLLIHMGSKQTGIKWRFGVLERLQRMFQTLVLYKKSFLDGDSLEGGKAPPTFTFNASAPQFYGVKRHFANAPASDLSFIGTRSGCAAPSTEDGTQTIRRYVEHLMPLFLEAWIEVRPEESWAQSRDADLLLTQDAAKTLQVVLEIIVNLWLLVDACESHVKHSELGAWFQREFADTFASQILQNSFPYEQRENESSVADGSGSRAKKAKPLSVEAQMCVQQNLNLVYLFNRFFVGCVPRQAPKFLILLQYLHKITSNFKQYSLENSAILERALRAVLLTNGEALLAVHRAPTEALLAATIEGFIDNRFSNRDGLYAKILVLLCDLVQSPQLFAGYGSATFEPLLVHLPQLLLQPSVPEPALLSIATLGKQKNSLFLNALATVRHEVIENLQRMQVLGAPTAFEGKKHIMNLFYWIDQEWPKEEQQQLLQKVEDHVTDKRMLSYFQFVITKGRC